MVDNELTINSTIDIASCLANYTIGRKKSGIWFGSLCLK